LGFHKSPKAIKQMAIHPDPLTLSQCHQQTISVGQPVKIEDQFGLEFVRCFDYPIATALNRAESRALSSQKFSIIHILELTLHW
jgi:hypothetical protein